MKTKAQCCSIVAQKHNVGNSLVTGHRASFFMEATDLYVIEELSSILSKLDPNSDKVAYEILNKRISELKESI